MTICSKCGKEITTNSPHFTGYGVDSDGNKFCYTCCAENDKDYMRDHDRTTLYLYHNNLTDQNELDRPEWEVINWPGTLRFKAYVRTTIKKHTIWRIRHDVWFQDNLGFWWYGRNQGDNDLVHCKRLKYKPDFLYVKNTPNEGYTDENLS